MFREHFVQTYQGILYSNLARPTDQNDMASKKVRLGERDPKCTISRLPFERAHRTLSGASPSICPHLPLLVLGFGRFHQPRANFMHREQLSSAQIRRR